MTFLPKRMFVYPAPRQSAQGRSSYSYVTQDGTQIPAGRTFAKQATKTYMFPSSYDNSKINTGLSEHIENPFLNKEFADKYIKDEWLSEKDHLTTAETVTKQTYFEVVHNRPKGTYTDEKKVKEPFDTETTDNNFFERFSVSLVDDTNIFVEDSADGALAMMLMYQNPRIAKSKDECNPSVHDFYIGQEHQALIEKSNKRQKASRAVAKLQSIKDNYDSFTMYKLGIVLGLVKGVSINHQVVADKLDDYIWTQTKDYLQRLDKFMEVAKLVDDDKGIARLNMIYMIKQSLNTNVMSISNGSYIWHSQRGIDNLYNLGTKEEAIYSMFAQEYVRYNPDLKDDNFYGKLVEELKSKGVKIES